MNNSEILSIQMELSQYVEDYMLGDKERCHGACKYKYINQQKTLVETYYWRKVWHKDTYLGITFKTDPRFDSTGQYVGGKLYN